MALLVGPVQEDSLPDRSVRRTVGRTGQNYVNTIGLATVRVRRTRAVELVWLGTAAGQSDYRVNSLKSMHCIELHF